MPVLSHIFLTESLLTLSPPSSHPRVSLPGQCDKNMRMALSLASIKHLSGTEMKLYSYFFQAIKEGAQGTCEHCLTEGSLLDEDFMGAA